jgi:hypothetical protein
MKLPKIVDSRLGNLCAALFMLVSIAAPAALTATASAAVVTNRSIALDNSSAGATTNYQLTFTTGAGAAGAYILAFCDESPIPGDTCTGPTGFDATGASVSSGTITVLNANTIKVVGSLPASTQKVATFTGFDNPSAAGVFYARILTYADDTAAGGYDIGDDGTTVGTYIDEGGFALSATNPINVSAAVRESMTFCVYGDAISANCTVATQPPNLELGEGDPGLKALEAGSQSTGDVYSQVSTNAVGGVVVKMRTNNACGGLKRSGTATCDIAPVGTSTDAIAAGTPKFGLKVAADSGLTPTTNYAGSNFGLNYDAGNTTGVTSPYGDPLYSSTGPVDSKNATMTFAASINSTTPAGKYTAALNLIATGTF